MGGMGSQCWKIQRPSPQTTIYTLHQGPLVVGQGGKEAICVARAIPTPHNSSEGTPTHSNVMHLMGERVATKICFGLLRQPSSGRGCQLGLLKMLN